MLVILIFLASTIAKADGGGLLIPNVPPTFKSVNVDLQKDSHHIEIIVFDTNGAWGSMGDIYKITVRIYDTDESILAAYSFKQYDAINSTLTINEFTEIEGTSGILLLPDCTVTHPIVNSMVQSGEQQLAGSQLNVTFTTIPVNGYRMVITVEDREGASSVVDGPYYKEAKAFSKESAVAASVASLVIAGAVSSTVQIMQQRRGKS